MEIDKVQSAKCKVQNKSSRLRVLSFKLWFYTLIFSFCAWQNVHSYTWKTIDTGLSYTKVESVHVFQIDPKKFRLSVMTAKDLGEKDTTAAMIAKKSKAVLVVNGGFFSPEHKSLGLLMRDGKTINPIHPTSWWAVFQMNNEKASIVTPRYFNSNSNVEMALQVGPRLVVNGAIPKLKPSLARRSGIGIKNNGNLIIAVSDNNQVSMENFAILFQKSEAKGGLECTDALNLDGGGSSQLYFNWNGFKLDVSGVSRIANAITVAPRH